MKTLNTTGVPRPRLSALCAAAFFIAGCTSTIEAPPGAQPPGAGNTGSSGSSSVAGTAGSTGQPGTGGSTATGGSTGSGGTNGMPDPDPDGNVIYEPPTPDSPALPARTWRLTHAQYQKAVQDFVGATIDVADLEPEIDNGVYPNMSGSGLVRVTLASGYYQKAEQVATALTTAQLSSFVSSAALNAAAKDAFLQAAISKAFRRPATPDDITAFSEIFDLGAATTTDGTGGFRAVIRALLTSPFFLYRTEIGADPAAPTFNLTGHEVASLLSFSLLGAPPSASLLAAAERGELTAPTQLAAQVEALLSAPEAAEQLASFLGQWLKVHHFAEIDKDAAVFPQFESVRGAMLAETEQFLASQTGPTGTLQSLLTTPVVPTGQLATFYASDPSSGGSVGTRTGVLGLGAVVSLRSKPNSTSPTLRGLFVRERFLCQAIHLPPQQPPDITETQERANPRTIRELYELHASDPTCAGCHLLIDPIGFTFEELDAAGRFRTMDNGYPLDTSGQLVDTDVNRPINNHTELAQALAASEWVRECVAIQAFRFYYGLVERSRGVPAVQAARVRASTGSVRDMVAAIMSSESTYARVRN